jgi:hypothetical protein
VSITEIPVAPPESVVRAEHLIETVQIAKAVKDAAVAELAVQVGINDRLAAKNGQLEEIVRQRNAELAEAARQLVRVEADRDALLESCFARQAALTEPATVRENRLAGQVARYRGCIARIERLLDGADADNRALIGKNAGLTAENVALRRQLEVRAAEPAGRGRRGRSR